MIPTSVVPVTPPRSFTFPNLIPAARTIPPTEPLTPDVRSINLPVTPPIPPVVQTGDVITSTHENTVTTALGDLWTNEQAIAAAMLTDPTTTQGDLIVRGTSGLSRLGAGGTSGSVLTLDMSQPPLLMAWKPLTPSTIGAVPITRSVLAGAGMNGGGPLSADVTLNANVVSVNTHTGAVTLTAADVGGVPTTRRVIAGTGMSGGGALSADVTLNVALSATDIVAGGGVPATRRVIAGAGLAGGGALSADVTLTAPVMGASGASHAPGIVPDPGATAGSAHYLREDGQWAVPPGAGGGMNDPTTTKGDLIVNNGAGTTRIGTGGAASNGFALVADASNALGVKWAAVTSSPAGAQGQLQFNNAGAFGASSLLIWDTGTNRLGVGVATPAYRLDVSGDINISAGSVFRVNGVPLALGGTPAGTAGQIQFNNGAGAFGATWALNWDNANNWLGIQTSPPSCALHVLGNNGTDGIQAFFAVAGGVGGIAIGGNGTIGLIEGRDFPTPTGVRKNIALQPYGGRVFIGALTGGGESGGLEIRTGDYLGLRMWGAATNNNVQARWAGGKAAADLWAVGTDIIAGTGGTDFCVYDMTSGPVMVFAQGAGRVGIGTSLPTSGCLQVVPRTNPSNIATANQVNIGEVSNNASYRLNIGYGPVASGGNYAGVIDVTPAGGAQPLLLNPSGSPVGIYTTSPSTNCLLSLGSSIANNKIAIYDGGGNDLYGIGVESGYLRFNTGASGGGYKFFSNPSYFPSLFIGSNNSGSGLSFVGINTNGPVDVLSINAMPYAGSNQGGIRIQTPSNEQYTRFALNIDGTGFPYGSISMNGTDIMRWHPWPFLITSCPNISGTSNGSIEPHMPNSSIVFWMDQGANTLRMRIRYSDGSLHVGNIAVV